jgi:hypothetical protein
MQRLAFLTAALAAGACFAQSAGTKPPELLVWTGDQPAGQTWAKLGPGGSLKVEAGAGLRGGRGLVLHMDGEGWRGGGLNWKGWYPPDAGDDASRYNALVFHVRQVTKVAGADLAVSLVDNVKRKEGEVASNAVGVVGEGGIDRIDGQWRRVVLPLERFTRGKPLQLARLWEIDFGNQGSDVLTFAIDRIGFAVEKVRLPHFKAAAPYHATARVVPDREVHRIRDGIYGVCGLPRSKLEEYGIPITRWGGNPSSRYNWRLNVDSSGSDWFFKNRGEPILRPSDTGYLKHIQGNQAIGATTYQTVPMLGWVAKDGHSYGYSVAKYGPQKATEPGYPDVGNGVRPDGSLIAGNDPRDTSVEAPPEFIEEAVRFVVKRAGHADGSDGTPGVKYWVLDNEPMLWHVTHRDVHPKGCGYEEFWDRTVRYAEAIKRADPTAKVAGFCSWGWMDLNYAGLDQGTDNYRTRADWQAHGKVGLAEWFLKQCAEYRKAHGKPLVDVFDVHWYPQGEAGGHGVYKGRGMDPALNELRMRSTRDLWDPTYQQESWIRDMGNYSPVALLPRVRKWIDEYNPGMELCLGEYNFGGPDNITGGLAQVEVFGRLAEQRLDLAFTWYTPEGTQELAWKLFRSYDGRRARFGERWLRAVSDRPNLSVFASRRGADNAITVALVNKDLHSPCELSLDLGSLAGKVRVWRFDQETGDQVVEVNDAAGPVRGTVELKLPAASASMVVLTPE